jgi:hypothetical protein
VRAHVIEDGKVVNTIEVESLDFLPNLVDASLGGSIGDAWDGLMFAPPPPTVVVPQSVTRFQGLAALDQDGKLDAVEALMADPATPKIFKLAYQNALNFERGSQTVSTMAAALGWSDEYVDQLFIAASGIVA